jgi:hypothetical protein
LASPAGLTARPLAVASAAGESVVSPRASGDLHQVSRCGNRLRVKARPIAARGARDGSATIICGLAQHTGCHPLAVADRRRVLAPVVTSHLLRPLRVSAFGGQTIPPRRSFRHSAGGQAGLVCPLAVLMLRPIGYASASRIIRRHRPSG